MKFSAIETIGVDYYAKDINVVEVAKGALKFLEAKGILSAIEKDEMVSFSHDGMRGPRGRTVATVQRRGDGSSHNWIVDVIDEQWPIGYQIHFRGMDPIASQYYQWDETAEKEVFWPAEAIDQGDEWVEELNKAALQTGQFSSFHCSRCFEHMDSSGYTHYLIDKNLVCSKCITEQIEATHFFPDGSRSRQTI